ncbi:acetamidase [Capsulimonas corticalis]|uniref:Acetamidase n=1 Tax=Capsulimonas corticalis TaxID=2219043 RepID=A0A402CW70_9BACT|nr:acetamidase/formamidase family protein [Capsulimonas corticalis]BDI34038.1 acetamidase [Capsulimonas corticalis]
MTTYTIEPTRETLHGAFSRDFAPVLIIEPGDTVLYRTLDAAWNVEPRRSTNISERPRKFESRRTDGSDNGHCLCGPIAIRGARPGMTLEVGIQEVSVGAWGWTSATGWPHPVNQRLGLADGEEIMHLWALDGDNMTGRNQYGHEVKLRPFMGVMGMPPDEPGLHSTSPPRTTGGNLDCKELTAGSTLYLPIAVDGGLFSVGDGYAVQGDGEVCVTAIECPMERVTLTFNIRDDLRITTPRARTPEAFITLGLHEDLDEAGFHALEAMLEVMMEQYGLERRDALALASLVVDMRVTQIVNGVQGIHAVLPHNALIINPQ